MRIQQDFAVLAITLLQLFTASAQTSPTRTSPSGSAYMLPPGATEVEKLTQSGVGDDVVLSYIGQSQIYYNLSAADIVALKKAGVSSQAVTAMLNHDSALRTQQQSSSPATAPAAAPQTTVTQFDATAPTAIANPTSGNTTVVVQSAPPPQVEVIPVTPGPDYVWTPGFWSWNSGAWIWIGGYWHYPSRPGHVWIGGHWAGHGRGRAWVGGHWR
jgi:WXXGXW repeat (2 copies)